MESDNDCGETGTGGGGTPPNSGSPGERAEATREEHACPDGMEWLLGLSDYDLMLAGYVRVGRAAP